MNDDLEKQLREVRLAAPSAELDRRMNDIFKGAAMINRPMRRVYRWRWFALSAGAAAAALLLVLLRQSPPPIVLPVRPLVYQIAPQGLMRELLLSPPARLQTPPVLVVGMRR